MSASRRELDRDRTRASRDRGFTLVEMLIALVLSGIVAGVTVAAMMTSMNAVSSTADQVADSTDAGLISAYLFRDAQAAGGTAASANADARGVVTAASAASDGADPWNGCTQVGLPVVSFRWATAARGTEGDVVASYALAGGQLTRRVCEAGAQVDVVLGSRVATAAAACAPDPTCGPATETVSLAVEGTGTRAPFAYTLTASLRVEEQPAPTVATSAAAPLIVVGAVDPAAPCPIVELSGTGSTKVIGDAVVSDECGAAPVAGDQTRLQPTGAALLLDGVHDPYADVAPRAASCGAGTNPSVLGASAGPDALVVHPGPVLVTGAVDWQPGTYVFCSGLTFGSGAEVTGDDVFLDVAGGSFTVVAGAEVRLAAARDGARANLLVRVADGSPVAIHQSIGATVLDGVLDAPASAVSLVADAPLAIGGLVAATVEIAGPAPIRLGLPVPAMRIGTGSLTTGQQHTSYPTTVLAVSGGTGPFTWSATGLPAGLVLSPTGEISGTPTVVGDAVVRITVFDATNAAAAIALPLHVRPAPAVVGPPSLPDAQVGVTYPPGAPIVASATGGTAPFAWSATGMPSGIAIAADGQISGAPTSAGSFTVTLRVTDALGAVATRALPLLVRDPLVVAQPSALDGATAGAAYPVTTIVASGGAAPYSWSATGLPSGMTLNGYGQIRGTPTAPGTYEIAVTVTDQASATATRTYPLVVAAASGVASPVAYATGFQLLVERDAQLAGQGVAGAIAVGGDVGFTTSQTVAATEASSFTVAGAQGGAGMIAGGRVDLAGSNAGAQLTVGAGFLHVGDAAGADIVAHGRSVHLVPSGVTDPSSTPRVVVAADQTDQAANPVGRPDAYPFTPVFTALRATSTSIGSLDPETCASVVAPGVSGGPSSFSVALTAGAVNVWSLTVAQISSMVSVTGPVLPGGATTLVVNVTDAGSVSLPTRTWTLVRDGAPSSILWNFPNATSLTVPNGFGGTLFAPRAAVTLQNVQLRGDVVAKSLAMNGGTGAAHHFTPQLPCMNAPLAVSRPAALAAAQAGTPVPPTSFTGSGGSAPYTWSAVDVPAGITLSSGGVLSGTPTTAGEWTFAVTVTDEVGATATRSYTLAVGAPPSITAPAALPQGEVAVAYASPTFTIAGGTAPFTWSATGLPAGLTMSGSGTLGGTPTVAGSANVQVRVQDALGAASVRQYALVVAPSTCAPTEGRWAGQYYKNTALSGTPVMCRQDAAIQFDWGLGGPGGGLPSDLFSVRWTTKAVFQAGTYDFTKISDDGWRMYIDGALVLNDWNDQTVANGVEVVSRAMTAGTHTIVVEYYDRSGPAAAALSWKLMPPVACPSATASWVGRYYSNRNLQGSPVLCRDDGAVLDVDWGNGAPDPKVPPDGFSVRWTRTATVPAGTYRLVVGSNDGIRVWVDGYLVVNAWYDRAYTSTQVVGTIAAGTHSITVEFYERDGPARATVTWSKIG